MRCRGDRKADPDRRRDVLVVFDLGLGQRRALDDRPEHRLEALVEAAVEQELVDLADDLRLGAVAHRQVRIVPVADDAESLELLPLHCDPVLGELAAFLAQSQHRDVVLAAAGLAVPLLHLPLDRQPVAVPTRHVVGVVAAHLPRAHDDVLEDLVHRRADVDVAVGVGRTVMEDESLPPGRLRAQPAVQAHLLPAAQQSGLQLRQAGTHREVGARQQHGRSVVDRFGGRHNVVHRWQPCWPTRRAAARAFLNPRDGKAKAEKRRRRTREARPPIRRPGG